MRTIYIRCLSRSTAARRAPWAAVIRKACGGFIAFESSDDARVWANQR